jgi:hypothetical protein
LLGIATETKRIKVQHHLNVNVNMNMNMSTFGRDTMVDHSQGNVRFYH